MTANFESLGQILADQMRNRSTKERKRIILSRLEAAYKQGYTDAKQEIRNCLGIEYRD